MRPYIWRGDYLMDGRDYKNYKIAFNTLKKIQLHRFLQTWVTLTALFPPLQFFKKCWQNTTMYKKLFMFLNQVILDLSTREFFLLCSIWKNESVLPMAPAPANLTNTF